MKIEDIKPVLKLALEINDSVILEGYHGIGKSEILKQFAEENGLYFVDLRLSNNEVGDLIGNPRTKKIDNEYVTYWTKPTWLKRIEDKDKNNIRTMLLLDEIGRAQQDVRQSALQLVLDKQIHEHILPKETFIVAANNPSRLGYQTEDLDFALLDRFLCIDVEIDSKSWLIWAKENNINDVVINFISKYPDLIHYMPEDLSDSGATPRSYEKISKYLDNGIPDKLLYYIFKGRLGKHTAGRFLEFYNNYSNRITTKDLDNFVNSNLNLSIEEIANGMKEKFFANKNTIELKAIAEELKITFLETKSITFLVFLYALNIEVLTSFLKEIKENDDIVYKQIIQLDSNLNNKNLFRKISSKINI